MAEEITPAGRTIAVTGAGGFIGAALCRRLAADGATVIAIDIDPAAAERLPGIEFRRADTTDPADIAAALAGAELIAHTAAIVSEAGSMAEHVRVNVGGTANLLAAAGATGAKGSAGAEGPAGAAGAVRVLHLSSVAIYGYEHVGDLGEDAPRRACGVPYIDTKSASDRLALAAGAIVLRPGDVYGPGSMPWTVRPVQLAKSGLLGVPRGPDREMLAIYIDDLVEAAVACLTRGRPGRAYTAYNTEERVTFGEYFDRCAELAGVRRPLRLPPAAIGFAGRLEEGLARRRGRPPRITRFSPVLVDRRGRVTSTRLADELGWHPRVGIDEGMARTAEWLREVEMI